jgi:hypothetical protein
LKFTTWAVAGLVIFALLSAGIVFSFVAGDNSPLLFSGVIGKGRNVYRVRYFKIELPDLLGLTGGDEHLKGIVVDHIAGCATATRIKVLQVQGYAFYQGCPEIGVFLPLEVAFNVEDNLCGKFFGFGFITAAVEFGRAGIDYPCGWANLIPWHPLSAKDMSEYLFFDASTKPPLLLNAGAQGIEDDLALRQGHGHVNCISFHPALKPARMALDIRAVFLRVTSRKRMRALIDFTSTY